MLYTGKGDKGTTKVFGCDQRFSKSSAVANALGSVDELNSFLGLCKVKATETQFALGEQSVAGILDEAQNQLFIVQAHLAGADKQLDEAAIKTVEKIIGDVEAALPPIHSFFVSGGTELGALFDVARTIARRAERAVVAYYREGDPATTPYGQDPNGPDIESHQSILAYANRLSSLLYAFARLATHQAGITEAAPHY